MKPLATIATFLAGVLFFAGLVFVVAAGQSNTAPRLAVGAVLIAAAIVLALLVRAKRPTETHVHRYEVDLPGDTALQQMTCRECGGPIGSRDVSVKAGAAYVDCQHCGTTYQLEEAPKW